MDTTELFKFKFVDRIEEQEKLNKFFREESENTLWIKGERGMGKTTFFHYVFKKWSEYELCFIGINNSDNSTKIITNFITELQKHCSIDFLQTVKKNYKKFYNSIYKTTKDISDEFFPTISKVVSFIIDTSYHVINLHDEKKNSINIITEYITLILKNKKLCICIDDFSRCDLQTAQLFFQIFKSFKEEDSFRSCIITTTEELHSELLEEIQRNLPYRKIDIEKLNEYIYFYEILNPIFDLEDITLEELKYLYLKCKGSPKKLATVISKMLDKNGISVYSTSKAKINKDILHLILQTENIKYKETDFDTLQKWIIFSFLCLSEKVSIEQLKSLSIYIATRNYLYQGYNEEQFRIGFIKLFENRVFNYTADGIVTVYYDSDYRELMDIFYSSPIKGIFSQHAYEFLKLHPEYPESRELLCKNARVADMSIWTKINFCYGKYLSKNKQFYDAQKYFSYLNSYFNKLHVMQVLYIALNSYETGNYQLAINQLNSINPENLKFQKAKYYYYFLLGKSYNNTGLVSKGAITLEKALEQVTIDSEEYVQTLNILHMYYFEIPKKVGLSFEIFQTIRNKYRELHPRLWANTMRGCHNFLKPKEALSVLQEADSIVEDDLEKAYIKTTIGFILVQQDNINEAQKQFENACRIIKPLKIHEYSYAANNLAICYMLNGEYQKSKEILIEALFWNRTEYGKIVIQTHLMMCTAHLKQFQETEEYYSFLVSYMENNRPQDPILNRKVYMNLAIASKYLDLPIQTEAFYNKASTFIKDTTSEWRYYSLLKKKCPVARPTIKSHLIEDFEPWFLVYAHD